jgi:hypothetical protein
MVESRNLNKNISKGISLQITYVIGHTIIIILASNSTVDKVYLVWLTVNISGKLFNMNTA